MRRGLIPTRAGWRITVGSTIKPVPPVRRIADNVRQLVQLMAVAGFGGNEMIARFLARAGWRVSSRSVGRMRKEKARPAPTAPATVGKRVSARHPNDVVMMDLTEIPSLFHLFSLKLGMVLDAFSRFPLAARLFRSDPTSLQMAELFTSAAAKHGKARHVVTDQGVQFKGEAFRKVVAERGTRHRFGAVGKPGSIAVIERTWRTLKAMVRLRRPELSLADHQRLITIALAYYGYERPHSALGGATPAEVYFGVRPAHLDAIPAPRGRPGEGLREAPFDVVSLDPDLALPVLVAKLAA